LRRPLFHLVIIALVASAAAYAGLMPNHASSRASGLINPAEGLSYSSVVSPSQNTTAVQSVKNSIANPINGVAAPPPAASSAPTTSAGLATLNNQAEVLSAGLQAPNFLTGLTLTASECDTTQSDKYCVYTVQEGDTLSSIAATAGLKTTEDVANWELLLHSNKPDISSEDDLLQPGQKLRIPRGQGVVHTVLSNETISDLSDEFDVPVEDIMQANGITDADKLAIGDELLIPGPKRFASPVIVEESAAGGGGPQIVGGGPKSDVGFIWPTSGPISSYFSASHPLGIDIDLFGRAGAPIAAVKGGTVTFAGGNPCCSYGYYVVVDHGDGFQTLYAHLSSIAVSQGQHVAQGQLLGGGGQTGYATGNHLHFEVHRNGAIVNPLSYLP
jgi:murein DD-endopeptidase MepM/ murein hydrolase activator NlpD